MSMLKATLTTLVLTLSIVGSASIAKASDPIEMKSLALNVATGESNVNLIGEHNSKIVLKMVDNLPEWFFVKQNNRGLSFCERLVSGEKLVDVTIEDEAELSGIFLPMAENDKQLKVFKSLVSTLSFASRYNNCRQNDDGSYRMVNGEWRNPPSFKWGISPSTDFNRFL